MIFLLINLIQVVIQVITVVVIIDVFTSYFMSPFHPVRIFIGRIVNPMLNPIRRVIPSVGGLDFSPFVLIILLQILGTIIIRLLLSL